MLMDTGITKEYTHDKGFFGDRTDVKVFRGSRVVASGNVKKDFWGRSVVKLNHKRGVIKESVKKMDQGFFGDRDTTVYYGRRGREVGNAYGRQGLFNGYERHYRGACSRYN